MSPKHGSINAQMLEDLRRFVERYVHKLAKEHPIDPTYRKLVEEEVANHMEEVVKDMRENG